MSDRITDLREQLDSLLNSKPETGAAWAEIALVEKLLIEEEQEVARENGQFGVGA
jgi:hypothetical protein